jgi:hypothetical protein
MSAAPRNQPQKKRATIAAACAVWAICMALALLLHGPWHDAGDHERFHGSEDCGACLILLHGGGPAPVPDAPVTIPTPALEPSRLLPAAPLRPEVALRRHPVSAHPHRGPPASAPC